MKGNVHSMVLDDAGMVQTANSFEGLLQAEDVFFLDFTHLHSELLSGFSMDAPLDPSVGTFSKCLGKLVISIELLDVLSCWRLEWV